MRIGVGYMTRLYRRRPEQLNGKVGAIIAAYPPGWRFGAILAQEGERWTVSLGGSKAECEKSLRHKGLCHVPGKVLQ